MIGTPQQLSDTIIRKLSLRYNRVADTIGESVHIQLVVSLPRAQPGSIDFSRAVRVPQWPVSAMAPISFCRACASLTHSPVH